MREPWRTVLRALLMAAAAAVAVLGVASFRADHWPVYLAFSLLVPILFLPAVAVLPGIALPLPSIAVSIAFVYIGGLPTVILEVAISLAMRLGVVLWRRRRGVAPFGRGTLTQELMRARTGFRGDWLGNYATGPLGMAARWSIVSALAPGGPPVTDAVAIAAAEVGGFFCWALLSFLPIYPDRPLFPYREMRRWGMGRAAETPSEEEYRAVGSDLTLLFILTLPPFVFLVVYGFRTHGLAGAVLWSLSTLGLHLVLKRLNERRLTVEEQNRRLAALNRELQRSERLSAIGKMSSVISHEILHELGVIGIQTDLIRHTGEEGEDATAVLGRLKGHGLAIEGALGNVNRVVRDLLVFSKDLRLNLYEHPLRRVVEESVADHRELAIGRAVRLRCDCSAETTVKLDKLKMRQAIGNVLRNAVEASPHGGEVLVRMEMRNGAAEIRISDGGPGVAAADRDAVFTPFFTTKEHGTGLGLAIAREFTEAHGGRLWVEENAAGPGATFVFRLPVGSP